MVKKIFKVFTVVILIILFSFSALLAVSLLPMSGNYQFLSVLSGSMEPQINTGSLIFIKSENSYAVGDVVTRLGDKKKSTITHRIVSMEEEDGVTYFQTRGDANDAPDSKHVTQDMIFGKVVFDIPLMGYVINFVWTRNGLIIFIIIPALVIIFGEAWRVKKELQYIKKKKELDEKKKEG